MAGSLSSMDTLPQRRQSRALHGYPSRGPQDQSTLFSDSRDLERSTGTVTPVACISAKVLSVFSILSASRIGARKPSPESWVKIQAATAKALD